jgi:hypothetical protein
MTVQCSAPAVSFLLVFSHVQADALTFALLYHARQPEEADAKEEERL